MPHPTSQGLAQEEGALSLQTQPCLPDLEKRGIDAAYLQNYSAKTSSMEATVAAAGGKTSDKEQLTESEAAAKDELLADVRRVQRGVKHTFKQGSPQWKEFFIGEYFNHSTALLVKWANAIVAAWDKYKTELIQKSGLIQADIDSITANVAKLQTVDSSQEMAKHADAPEATAAAQKAMAEVEEIADRIYIAAESEYAKDPVKLGEFEALKPLRYAVRRNVPAPADGDNSSPDQPRT